MRFDDSKIMKEMNRRIDEFIEKYSTLDMTPEDSIEDPPKEVEIRRKDLFNDKRNIESVASR